MSNIVYVGLDDGHNNTCVVTNEIVDGDFKKILLPSRATLGGAQSFSIAGQEAKTFTYVAGGEEYTVGDVENTLATNFDDYPRSTMNRIIANHAMHLAGLGNKKVVVTSGLPVRQYFMHSTVNKKLIKDKKKNLLSSDVGGDVKSRDGLELPQVIKHGVIAEGVAAWFDYVVSVNSDGEAQFDGELARQNVAIIDIGGRTTDIAVIKESSLISDKSSTIDVGMLLVRNVIKGLIQEREEVSVNDQEIDRAVRENKAKIFGQIVDVSDIVIEAKNQALQKIRHEIKLRIGKGGDIDTVLFVGGGVLVFEEEIKELFPRNGKIAKDPLFAMLAE